MSGFVRGLKLLVPGPAPNRLPEERAVLSYLSDRDRSLRYREPRELDARWLAVAASEAGFSSVRTNYNDYFLGPIAWLAPHRLGVVAAALEMLDTLALGVPLVRRYASSFSLCAS